MEKDSFSKIFKNSLENSMAMKNHIRRNETIILRFVKLRWSFKNFKCVKKNSENGQNSKNYEKKFLALCFNMKNLGQIFIDSDPLETLFNVFLVIFPPNKSGISFLIKRKIKKF